MNSMPQKRYQGFLETPSLWQGNSVYGLEQFAIPLSSLKIDISIDNRLRLGKYVERLVSFQLSQQRDIHIIAENIQIQKEKITLGELDCLLLKDGKPIHLEVIYKFYLYDDSVGNSEIDHFIGPNRKDSLIKKLTKLKTKQLPLLYTDACKPYLKILDLKAEGIKQHVYFKAQLFLPYGQQDIQLKTLNNDCLSGFFISEKQLHQFNGCKFYIPSNKDWLVIPHPNVNWKNFSEFLRITKDQLTQNFSLLFWLKAKNGEIQKMFLVWW